MFIVIHSHSKVITFFVSIGILHNSFFLHVFFSFWCSYFESKTKKKKKWETDGILSGSNMLFTITTAADAVMIVIVLPSSVVSFTHTRNAIDMYFESADWQINALQMKKNDVNAFKSNLKKRRRKNKLKTRRLKKKISSNNEKK